MENPYRVTKKQPEQTNNPIYKSKIIDTTALKKVGTGRVYQRFEKSIKKAYSQPVQLLSHIEKSIEGREIQKSLWLEGIGSDNRPDLDKERMTDQAIYSMAHQINTYGTALNFGHNDGKDFGRVTGATVKDGKLFFRAQMDESNPLTAEVMRQIASGKNFSFSISGTALGRKGICEGENASKCEVFNVKLAHIALVETPANPRARLLNVIRRPD